MFEFIKNYTLGNLHFQSFRITELFTYRFYIFLNKKATF